MPLKTGNIYPTFDSYWWLPNSKTRSRGPLPAKYCCTPSQTQLDPVLSRWLVSWWDWLLIFSFNFCLFHCYFLALTTFFHETNSSPHDIDAWFLFLLRLLRLQCGLIPFLDVVLFLKVSKGGSCMIIYSNKHNSIWSTWSMHWLLNFELY